MLPPDVDGSAIDDGMVWRDGKFRHDHWRPIADDEPLSDAALMLSKARWLAERGGLSGRTMALGLHLEPGEAIDDIAADLSRFALIALSFPKFTDGRAFSTARLLREKYGFAGELRAVGNVLADQIAFMRRVGFDSFQTTHGLTRRALALGRIPEVTLHYQPVGERLRLEGAAGAARPWLRQGTTAGR
jgi:phosphoadenosine phosphosulfate reductase